MKTFRTIAKIIKWGTIIFFLPLLHSCVVSFDPNGESVIEGVKYMFLWGFVIVTLIVFDPAKYA